MKTQLAKWGNSLAVRIPSAFAEEINAREGSEVEVSVSRGRLVIAPVHRRYVLKDLVRGITQDNVHGETGWGKRRGREVW
ncbi:MAG: AbrB/MazE/SpoVT family DNA-binding domain-containing protein [Alphaproteobacteria bacterium]|nr:AbrB/MazE/SpoVT family DNA-binding domain-containing protein [Alphaproteobacteria bacterium]